MKKKWFVFALCGMMILALTACSSKKEETTQVANPMTEVSYQELIDKTGIDLPAPNGATDVKYFTIKMDDNTTMAQMDFTLDGKTATLRSEATNMASLDSIVNDLTSGKIDIKTAVNQGINISGLNYDWTACSAQEVAGNTALVFRNGNVGFIAWVDSTTGFLYNLGMSEGATEDVLTNLANKAFVPMQKNVG